MGSSEAIAGSGRHLKQWLTAREAAKRLGWHVKTIRRRCASGDIPHQRIADGPIRIRREWVETQEKAAGARKDLDAA